jgi:glycosyltransferase involved in cell wall biosynthesis
VSARVTPLHRLWQRLPHSLRREALFGGAALLAPRIARPVPAPCLQPLVVAGYFGAQTGLGIAAERLAAVLESAGLRPLRVDLTRHLRQGEAAPDTSPPSAIPPGPGTLLVHVNGPMLPWAMLALGRRSVAGKRVIGVWNWELPALPADWRRGFRFAHQVWVASRFTADAVVGPGRPPVAVVPYAVPDPDPAPLDRAAFGLPAEAFVALSVFDAGSSIARKNPLAAIRAHHQAFGDHPDRILVLKTHHTGHAGAAWEEVAAAAAERPNVRVLDRTLDAKSLWALQRSADVFVSLHRAEGFGMGIAEAMRIGRPVVATGWSGNMDFMLGEGAVAVPYDLVPARDKRGTYDMPDACWAEARVAEAARALAMLAEDPGRRAAMGRAAAANIVQRLAPAVVGERARAALSGPLPAAGGVPYA